MTGSSLYPKPNWSDIHARPPVPTLSLSLYSSFCPHGPIFPPAANKLCGPQCIPGFRATVKQGPVDLAMPPSPFALVQQAPAAISHLPIPLLLSPLLSSSLLSPLSSLLSPLS
ncbi:unnamed protein product, partial [Protopolystoma xenopodis]